MSKLPDGKLVCCKNGNSISWYHSNGKTKSYIPKHHKKLAEQLALKAYYEHYLSCLESEEYYTDILNRVHAKKNQVKDFYFKEKLGFRELLNSAYQLTDNSHIDWASADYPTNTYKPEEKKIQTLDGHFVRSKSEAMIADALFENKIPYRYEELFHFEGTTIYPDFTVIKPSTGKKMYWEHFGMMHLQKYRTHAYDKIELFAKAGHLPSSGLLTTFETYDEPLSPAKVQRVIEEYLL